jgi:xylulokinase
MKRYILAYDLGTGGNKASLYDEEGRCMGSCFVPYETVYPAVGWYEQRPADWWDAVVRATGDLLADSPVDRHEIAGLALSGQSLGVVPISRDGALMRDTTPIWSDTRAARQAKIFFNTVDENVWYRITGNGFSRECYAVFKVLWYRDHEPELYREADWILGSKDYINLRLTGRALTDHSYASGWGVYNLLSWGYDDELVAASGLRRDLLPPVFPSTHVVGTLTAEAADALELPQEVKVICGGVDNSCMALGAGNFVEGRVYLSLGSSAWIAVSSKMPLVDENIRPFVFTHVVPGMFTSATSIFSAGSSLKWVRDIMCRDLKDRARREGLDVYDLMTEEAQRSPAGANHLLFNPSLAGGSAAHMSPHLRGAFTGLDLSHSRADLIRATMEGITMDLKLMYDKLGKLCALQDSLLLVGGGSKSAFWRQMFADVFDVTVLRASVAQDAATLGAAAVAAVGTGIWKDFSPIDDIVRGEELVKPDRSKSDQYRGILPIFEKTLRFHAEIGDLMSAEYPGADA